jgi:hypothetical protein
VRIDWQGHKLGYIPRLDNAAASQLIDRGERLVARIAALAESGDPWRRISVEIDLLPRTDPQPAAALPPLGERTAPAPGTAVAPERRRGVETCASSHIRPAPPHL